MAGLLAMAFIVALLALASVWIPASSTTGFLGTETGSSHGVVLATQNDTSPATSPELRTANAGPSDLRAPASGATARPLLRSIASAVAAESGSQIAVNAAAGNAARDALAAAHPGSLIEQSFTTTAGVRRLDILTQSRVGIESKVGRTSLTAATRSQIAKDSLLLGNGDVTGIEWVFSRSGVTGQIGPTGPLASALDKAGIPWSLAP